MAQNPLSSCNNVANAGNAVVQAYYLQAPFAIERAPTVSVRGIRRTASSGVSVVQLAEYPVRGLVFEANGSLDALAALVGGACQRLAAANVPHNLFIADCGARVFLLPNAFAERKVSLLVSITPASPYRGRGAM